MHSGMGGDIVVMEPQEYAQWMAGAARAVAGYGKQLFSTLGCSTCHRSDVQGRGQTSPDLQQPVLLEDGRTVVADETTFANRFSPDGKKS